jgi:hypothetical protein
VALVAAWAVLHVFVGRQGVLNHDWWWWPVTGALVVCAGAVAGILAEYRRPAALASLAMLVGLSVWWTLKEYRHAYAEPWVMGSITSYSPRELGQAVQSAAPPGRAVMIFEKDLEPYTVYYCNRPIIQEVWDVPSFKRRYAERQGDLFYHFYQTLDAPPVGYVFPKVWEDKGQFILPYLRAHYPQRDGGKFWIFDLSAPAPVSRLSDRG